MDEQLREILVKKIKVKEVGSGKFAILFPVLKAETNKPYELYLVKKANGYVLSDEGSTMAELEKIFYINEPEVVRNLATIAQQYGCRRDGNAIVTDCADLAELPIKIGHLIQALSFMLNMKIFYV